MITLVLNEQQESMMPLLLELFQAMRSVEVICCDRHAFRHRGDLDALLLTHPVAFELLGGLPAQSIYDFTSESLRGRRVSIRDAQLVQTSTSTKQLPFTIDWVVSGPTFPANIRHDGGRPFSMTLGDASLTPELQDYVIFARTLQIIHEKNADGGTRFIQRVGCTLDDFSIATRTEDASLRELQAIRQACIDFGIYPPVS